VQEAVTEVAAIMGENVRLRRGFVVSSPTGIVSSYLHASAHPGLSTFLAEKDDFSAHFCNPCPSIIRVLGFRVGFHSGFPEDASLWHLNRVNKDLTYVHTVCMNFNFFGLPRAKGTQCKLFCNFWSCFELVTNF